MKISVENLGPVTHAEFELKPLTVFIGDNCEGKTQTIVTATTMLGEYGLYRCISHYLNSSESNELIPEIEKLYQDLITTSQAELDLVEFSSRYLTPYYATLGKLTPKCLSDILGYAVPVEKTAVAYTLSEMEKTKMLSQIQRVKIQNFNPKAIPKFIKELDSLILHLYIDANQEITLPKQAIIHTLLGIVLGIFQKLIIGDLYLFPSERVGFQQASPQPGENSQNIIRPYALRQYRGLVQDTLSTGSSSKRLEAVEKNSDIAKIQSLSAPFTTITKDIISLSTPEPIFPRKVQIQVHDKVLDIQAASSGVKGLIGLFLYLQYIAKRGDLIVIDEPEQNLHPNQQAAFAEFLTLLVNNNVRVAITTHSPYIIEHLQNLILAHDLKDKKEIVDNLYLKREDSFIDKERVGVYLFQNGTAENILMEDGEINWQTFCDTANTIGNIASLVYDQQHEEQECRMGTVEMSVAEDETKYRR